MIKVGLVTSLIISSVFRYIGAVQDDSNKITYSIQSNFIGFMFVMNILCYNVFWVWLGTFSIYFIVFMPIILLIITNYILMPLEYNIIEHYLNKKPKILITDLSLYICLWITLSLTFAIFIPLIIPLIETKKKL